MHELTMLLKNDMKPALGVTEPGAIAFSVAKAKSYTSGELVRVHVAMNSGMYKNAFTCGIPGSSRVGSMYAAALGYAAGKPELGLQSLEGVTSEDNEEAERLVKEGKVEVSLSGITSRIFIEATVETDEDTAVVTIRDSHTNIVCITVNDEVVFGEAETAEDGNAAAGEVVTGPISDAVAKSAAEDKLIHRYTLAELVEYADTVDISEITFIGEAYVTNLELLMAGLESNRTTFGPMLKKKNGDKLVSDDEQKTASLMCNGAIEARVIGLDKPAMSITGSGAHGIIATMPLYAAYCVNHYPMEKLLRATALSYLVCTYIKEYSGKLSAFCGCAIAAGSGMACALVYLRGGTTEMMAHTLNNMASSITGMICDGGNQGCVMKGIAACGMAFDCADLALAGISVDSVHGINGQTPEETMRNIGLIASPGMTQTEKTIVEIQQNKKIKGGCLF